MIKSNVIKLVVFATAVGTLVIWSPLQPGILDLSPQKNSVLSSATSTIRFYGDVMLGRHVETLLRNNLVSYEFSPVNSSTTPIASVINFESAMRSPHVQTPNFTFQFATKPETLLQLDGLQITHASLANNHAFDFGRSGYALTQESLTNRNIIPFGHPDTTHASQSVTILDLPKHKVALIGLHTLQVWPNKEDLVELFTDINNRSDMQIVYIHWGEEYRLQPRQRERTLAEELVELGADVIIGHHPHVVQSIEVIEGVPVFYSLGNFIFDQYFSPDVMDGLVIDVEIGENIAYTLYPVTSRHKLSQPQPMTKDEEIIFLNALAARSDPRIRDMIISKSIDLKRLANEQ